MHGKKQISNNHEPRYSGEGKVDGSDRGAAVDPLHRGSREEPAAYGNEILLMYICKGVPRDIGYKMAQDLFWY